jgi:hypothetical protein
MSFAAPLFAWIAAGVAAATVVLHLLAWRRPPESPLPTARFAPERPIRMVSRAVRPADLALLALRVLIVLLVGVALAGPSSDARREGLGRVVVVDRSGSVGTGAEVAGAARAIYRAGDALVVFDSAARQVASPSADSLGVGGVAGAQGSLSAALIAAVRAATRLARERDSVEIVVVSPFASTELDAATSAIRATWRGRLRLVRVTVAPNDTLSIGRPTVRSGEGDPVAVSLALSEPYSGGASVRVVRDAPTTADSAWGRGGGAVVVWPGAPTTGWASRDLPDTAFAVTAPAHIGATNDNTARPATVVARFVRTMVPPAGRVIARWADGEPAATEVPLGTGCLRAVSVTTPAAGDLPLTPAFRHFARRMAGPCTAAGRQPLASDSALAAVLPPAAPSRDRLTVAAVASDVPYTKLTAWLLGLALVLGFAEMWVRRGGSDATA